MMKLSIRHRRPTVPAGVQRADVGVGGRGARDEGARGKGVQVAYALLFAMVMAAFAQPVGDDIPVMARSTGTQVQAADVSACNAAVGSGTEVTKRRAFMACMIARGYRTYVTGGGSSIGSAAQLMVSSRKGQSQATAEEDLIACGLEVQGEVGKTLPIMFVSGAGVAGATVRYQKPFATCLDARGYTAEPWAGERVTH